MFTFDTVLLVILLVGGFYMYREGYRERNDKASLREELRLVVEPIQETQAKYIQVLTDLPSLLEAAAAKDTHLTKENSLLKERLDILIDEAGESAETIIALTNKFHSLSDDLVAANEAIQEYRDALEVLKQEKTEVIEAPQAEDRGVDDTEFVDSIETVLESLGTPTSAYEVGVYNGVASVANTLIGEDMFELLVPQKMGNSAPKDKYNVRGEGGKFVKRESV